MKILKASNPRWFTQSDRHFKELSVHKATEVLSDWIDNAFSPFCQLYEICYDIGKTRIPKRKLLVSVNLKTVWNSSKTVDNVHN